MSEAAEVEIIRRHCHPLTPQPTGAEQNLRPLPDIRAVLFDIYGTLLISSAGDITLQEGISDDDAFREALREGGLPAAAVSGLGAGLLREAIAAHQQRSRSAGVEFPEVDIVAVWADVLAKISRLPGVDGTIIEALDVRRLAAEYEVRVNPVWPMPGMQQCLEGLRRRGLLLGIISNAQAMTPQLFPALLDQSVGELGFSGDLQFYSYRFGQSKPGAAMFRAAADSLQQHGVATHQAVFIGNDALKDVWAASQQGFRTILFAGDARSLRLRADDARVQQAAADCVVTDLVSIGACLED